MAVPRAKLKAQQKWREKMKMDGLGQVTVWVPEEYVERLKRFAKRLREEKPLTAGKRVSGATRPRW
jgi:hypothetical protein